MLNLSVSKNLKSAIVPEPISILEDVVISNVITIDRPIDDVFEFLATFENLPKWNYYLWSVRKISDGSIRIGSTFHQIRKSDSQNFKVIEFQHPNLITIETLPPERQLKIRYQLTQKETATILEDIWSIEGSCLIAWAAKSKIKAAVFENLTKLKTLLENGEVILQDGRSMRL